MVKRCVVTCCLVVFMLFGRLESTCLDNMSQVRDLLILLDDSASIPDAEWTSIKNHLVDIVNKVCGAVGGASLSTNRLAIATFSSTVQPRFDMTDFSTRSQYINAIRNMRQTKGTNGCLGRALDYGAELFAGLPNRRAQREVLILTGSGGTSCPGDHLIDSALHSLQEQAFVFGLNVGYFTERNRHQLESLVSRPLREHIFSLSNFVVFDDMVSAIKTYPRLCVPFEL